MTPSEKNHNFRELFVDTRHVNVMLNHVALLDLTAGKEQGGQDQDRQVDIAEDGVAGGDQFHNTKLGGESAEEQQNRNQCSIFAGGLFFGLAIDLGETGQTAEAEADTVCI